MARIDDSNRMLMEAVDRGSTSEADLALTHGADVNLEHNGLCPLHVAAAQGNELMVSMLLKHGARVNQVDPERRTAIWYTALAKDGSGAARLLLLAGADVLSTDRTRTMLLEFAVNMEASPGVLDVLLRANAAGKPSARIEAARYVNAWRATSIHSPLR